MPADSTREIEVATHQGHTATVIEHRRWIAAGHLDGGGGWHGLPEYRTKGGRRIYVNGKVGTLPDGDTFDLPQ